MSAKKETGVKSMVPRAIKDAFIKLNPKTQIQNPVMFIVYIASISYRCLVSETQTRASSWA